MVERWTAPRSMPEAEPPRGLVFPQDVNHATLRDGLPGPDRKLMHPF
jgi:hypothetical protein